MSAGSRGASGSDAKEVRRATRRIGWQITVAATTIVAVIILVSVLFTIDQSQPGELLEQAVPGQTKIYVDSGEVLIALLAIGYLDPHRRRTQLGCRGTRRATTRRSASGPEAFVSDASHESRTPLAVLDARIQVLQRRLPPDSDFSSDVTRIRMDSGAPIGVVNDLLQAASVDAPDDAMSIVDISEVVDEAVQSIRILATNQAIDIGTQLASGLRVPIAATSLTRCVIALLDNALAHSPAGSTITPETHSAKLVVELIIRDQGEGIQGIDPERIFDRFARSTVGVSTETHRVGFGIGLALVRDIVARHDGTVRVQSSTTGTTLVIALQRVRDDPA